MTSVEYYDEKVETASREEILRIQFNKLEALLKKVYASNQFYRKKFDSYGITPSAICSLNDLQKVPFTVKKEFEEEQEKHPIFGTNLTEPLENYVQYHQTSGTTGKPLKFLDTRESWDWRGKCACYVMKAAGVRKGDRIFFPFNFGPYTAFWIIYEGAYQLGNLIIPAGGWDSLQRLQSIIENQATVIPVTPSYAIRLGEIAYENHIDIANSGVRIIMLSGEPGGLVPGIREKIQHLWGAQCYDWIGMTEVGAWAFQCTEQPNAVHILESEFIAEIVDSEAATPVQEGKVGELVLTNLGRSCMPSIRYRTGDLARVKKGLCLCGRTFQLLDGGIIGRKDSMVIIRGVNIFPNVLYDIIENHIQSEDDYRIEAYRGKEGDEIAIQLEIGDNSRKEEVQRAIQSEIKKKLNLRIEVKTFTKGTFPKSDYKAKRFIDRRKESSV